MTPTPPEPSDGPVTVIIEDDRWIAAGLEEQAHRAIRALFTDQQLDAGSFALAVLAAGDDRIAALNVAWRERTGPTNVLSWPAVDLAPDLPGARPHRPEVDRIAEAGGEPTELGDIALAFETCAAEAEALGRPLEHHVAHLLIHGGLHLLGYDHDRDADAALMEATETRILAQLGVPDPY